MRIPKVVRNIATRVLPQKRPIMCIACGRTRSASRPLVSGPGFYVCAGCVSAELPGVTLDSSPGSTRRCDWCQSPRLRSDLSVLGTTAICLSCLTYVRSVFRDNESRLVT